MMTGKKNIIYLLFFILGFSFISQNSYSQDLSEEFTKDKVSVKFHTSESGGSKKLANLYIKKKGWRQGYNERDDGKGDFFVSIGTSGIQSDNSDDDFGDARQDAYDVALLHAKKSFIKYLGQRLSTQIASERKQGKYATPPKIKSEMEKFLDELDTFPEGEKVRSLINLELDKALKDAGYEDPTTPEAIEEAQKIIKKKDFQKTIEASAEHRLAGFQTKKIFEDSDGKKGSITVVGIWSEKLNLLADALVTGGDSPTGTPKQSLYDQIPGTDDGELSKWMFSYGASMTTNENGLASLISYGHASPLFDDVDEWVDACDQAILQAESFIVVFASETATYKENLGKSRSTDIFEKESKVAEMKTNTKAVKDYYKQLESSGSEYLSGIFQLNSVELAYSSGAIECVAAVGWSTDSSKSGQNMKKIQKEAEKIENQTTETTESTSDSSSGTAYEGESDEASDDFQFFFVLFFALNVHALDDQVINEYKDARKDLKINSFSETDNYYFFKGVANFIDYEDEEEAEFIAEADAYENLEVIAFHLICWPDYISTEIRIKILYEYLKIKPLMTQNEGFTILKKKKNREKDFEIIFFINKKGSKITFPSTTNLGFVDLC